MSEIPTDEPTKNSDGIRDLIDAIGKEKFGDERGQLRCRYINGTVLTELVNNHKLPGLVYTVQPDLGNLNLRFKRTNWGFHSVTILKVNDEDTFIAFDQINTQVEGEPNSGYYYTEGTLSDVSSNLEQRFGSHWDLTFGDNLDGVDPEITVRGKLNTIEMRIKSGELANVSLNDVTPDTMDSTTRIGLEDKELVKPLGLKYMPQEITANPNRSAFGTDLRKLLTFRYA